MLDACLFEVRVSLCLTAAIARRDRRLNIADDVLNASSVTTNASSTSSDADKIVQRGLRDRHAISLADAIVLIASLRLSDIKRSEHPRDMLF